MAIKLLIKSQNSRELHHRIVWRQLIRKYWNEAGNTRIDREIHKHRYRKIDISPEKGQKIIDNLGLI